MTTITYKNRRITVLPRRGRDGREYLLRINGVDARTCPGYTEVEKIFEQARRDIDFIDERPIGGWEIHWYDPKTVELCPEGIHTQPVGGTCQHETCIKRNDGPKPPCPKCETSVTRYRPVGHREGDPLWITAHRAPGDRRLLCGASDLPDRPGFAHMADKKIT
jgi:hypothetical protein